MRGSVRFLFIVQATDWKKKYPSMASLRQTFTLICEWIVSPVEGTRDRSSMDPSLVPIYYLVWYITLFITLTRILPCLGSSSPLRGMTKGEFRVLRCFTHAGWGVLGWTIKQRKNWFAFLDPDMGHGFRWLRISFPPRISILGGKELLTMGSLDL